MPKYVEYNGETVEFPDSMSDDEIATVLRNQERPTEGNFLNPIAQGATLGFSDEIIGLAGAAAGAFDPTLEDTTFGERYRDVRDIVRSQDEAVQVRSPIGSFFGELAGGVATSLIPGGRLLSRVRGGSRAAKLGSISGLGALEGGLYGLGTSEGQTAGDVAQDTLHGAALGAATAPILPALGMGMRSAGRRMFGVNDTDSFQRAVRLLEQDAGLSLTTGQKTGSRALRMSEETLGETLLGGRIAGQLGTNRQKLQNKLMRMAGFDMSNVDAADGLITKEAIDAAAKKFSRRYNQLLRGRTIDMDTNEFVDAIADVQGKHSRLLPFEQKRQINQIVEQLFDEATDGTMVADDVNRIRSSLGDLERRNASNQTLANLYRDLKHSIDDEVARQLGIGPRKGAIDKRYNRFTKIRDTFDSTAAVRSAQGDMPLSMLLKRVQAKGKGADVDFTEMVRAGQAVLGDPMANSTTASRLGNMLIMGEGLATAGGVVDPALAGATLGVPFLTSQMLSRGATGRTLQSALDRAAAYGVIPLTNTTSGLLSE